MQAIKCELCGSNEFTKVDGLFKCNHCRTKYTLEEAKKLIVSGTVEVVTGNAEKERLLKNADFFLKTEQIDKAATIYKDITNIFPDEARGWIGLLNIMLYHNKNFYHGQTVLNGYTYQTWDLFSGIAKVLSILNTLNYDKNHIITIQKQLYTRIITGKFETEGEYTLEKFKSIIIQTLGEELGNILINNGIEKADLYKKLGNSIVKKSFDSNWKDSYYSFDRDRNGYLEHLAYSDYGDDTYHLRFCIGRIFIFNTSLRTSTYVFETNEDLVIKIKNRITNNLCQHCGGEFKGLFKKVCSKCGKPKDY